MEPAPTRLHWSLNAPATAAVRAALVILLVIVAVAFGLTPGRADFAWFMRLRRPPWLTFEPLIPLIWLLIYACFFVSELQVWTASGRWDLMAGYLLLLLLVQSYTWVICRSRRLSIGTALGVLGWVWGVALTIAVARVSEAGSLLLIPYLL